MWNWVQLAAQESFLFVRCTVIGVLIYFYSTETTCIFYVFFYDMRMAQAESNTGTLTCLDDGDEIWFGVRDEMRPSDFF